MASSSAGVLLAALALLLAGCSTTSDHTFGHATDSYPLPWTLLLPLYGTPALCLLATVVGVLVVVVVIITGVVTRRGRRMPRWPLIVVGVLSGVMAVFAVVVLVTFSTNTDVTIAVAEFGSTR